MSDIQNFLKGVQENILLAPYTTFKIGGEARYFFIAKTAEEIMQAVQIAKELKISYYIIGNGSNILVSDNGFDGLIIKIQSLEFKVQSSNSKFKIIKCDGGVSLGKILNESIKNGLTGLEWMIGIPGTVGGAIYGNAGAFGYSIGENVESVEILDTDDLSVKSFNKSKCVFSYRHSIFQLKADLPRAEKKQKYIILSAIFNLKIGNKEEIEFLTKDYLAKRNKSQPIGVFSAGSFFKNPLIAEKQKIFERLAKKYFEVGRFRANGKIPAGWLIEECGLKGKKIGGAMVSLEHGNFIINIGGAKAEDIIMLISLIKQKIRVSFGIQLEEEIQYVGF